MSTAFKAALIQLNAGPEVGPNIDLGVTLIREARSAGADFILTPETSDLLEPSGEALMAKVRHEADHVGLRRYRDLAKELACWLSIGSFLIKTEDQRPSNRSFLISPRGEIVARYDKIHMFDVDIPDGQSYRESKRFRPGECAVIAQLPWGNIGLTICYDLRFPALYQTLAKEGALFLTVPSAFTRLTGSAHWHALLRARAIETGSYVLAAAQCGTHARGRETYGHSLIVSPWGEVLADGGEAPGFVMAEIDPKAALAARAMIPNLSSGRSFSGPAV